MVKNSRSCLTIILAAGEGKRMASTMPKVLHPVAGLPMVLHVLNTARKAGSTKCAVVVGNQAERVAEAISGYDSSAVTFIQNERKGTAHAVLAAGDALSEPFDDVVVLNGDGPLVRTETIGKARSVLADGADMVVLGFETSDPTGYGRMIVENGELVAIREHNEASDEEKSITFCNSGIMAFDGKHVLDILTGIGNDNGQEEYYLTDAVEVARSRAQRVVAAAVPHEETLGVNDRVQLAEVETIWQKRRRKQAMLDGVAMPHPDTVIFHHDTVVESDAALEPNVVFAGGVTIRSGATVRSFSHLEGCTVGKDAVVGPYARLRPGTYLEAGSKIGNFVETKNTQIRRGAKINHLSYVGDTEVGANANVGAGTITCNYDGYGKYHTSIGAGAFIGTNTSLVAPVNVGTNANTAAGSVIYKDVPDDALAIERGEQVNLDGKAKSLRARNKERKETASKG